jgi:hypothetical protein
MRLEAAGIAYRPACAAVKVEPKVEPEIAPTFRPFSVGVLNFQGKRGAPRRQKILEKQQLLIFKTGAFNHSATHPCNQLKWNAAIRAQSNLSATFIISIRD